MEVWELLSRSWEGRKKKKNFRKPFGKPQNILLLKERFTTSLLASFQSTPDQAFRDASQEVIYP